MQLQRPSVFVVASCLSILAGLSPLAAQEKYPTRSIELVIPFQPGGPSDIAARLFAEELKNTLKVAIVPLNKDGASGTIGGAYVFNAKKDGYTLLAGGGAWLIGSLLVKTAAQRDPLKDFIPISMIGTTPHAIFVKSDSPVKSLQDLVDRAKKAPGTVSYGHAGTASDGNFNVEIFRKAAGIELTSVAYKGGAPALLAVLGGHVDFGVTAMPAVVSYLNAGQIRILAINGTNKIPGYPSIPTFRETGFPQTFLVNWQGILAPAGLPQPIVDQLISASEEALKSRDLLEKLGKLYYVVEKMHPQQFREMLEGQRRIITSIAGDLKL